MNSLEVVATTFERTDPWTTKYNPHHLKDMVGNINVIKDAARYLKNYKCEQSPRADFPKAILVSGPTGVGKTEFAKLLALYRGYIPIEFSAALLSKKIEVERCVDIYRSDVTRNFSANHPLVIKALYNLDSCNMSRFGVGKAIIIDELDATSKRYKGLMTALTTILKSVKGHNPKNVIIMTCDDNTLKTKLKSMKNQCYLLKFKSVSDREMIKLIDRVSEGEHLDLQDNDKLLFVKYANGDCRRLLNGMELCFKNGLGEYTKSQRSSMINCFVNEDDETIQRLKFSTLSTEKMLEKVIKASISEGGTFDLIPYLQGDMYALGSQLYKTYPTLIRNDINSEDQIEIMAKTMVDIADADFFMDRVNEASGYDDGFAFSNYFIALGVLAPLSSLRKGIPKNFKMNVEGYAKIYGLKTSIDSQTSIKQKICDMTPPLFGKSFEEVRYFISWIAKQLSSDKHKELALFFHKNNIEPEVLDEMEKIKLMPKGDDNIFRCFGVELKDVWKAATKRKFKKEYNINKPETQGVKFREGKNVNKIMFFEKFM